ncbi:MAG: HEAT repeat domain-containing protein, partial [Roseburia sp.]|nr:HEAT repeat domain-containing protein [Roseburia sp.]
MLEISCEKLRRKENLRETLQLLRSEAKDGQKAEELRKLLGDGSFLIELLREEEPKVRKNAALLLGDLQMQQAAEALWEAYQRETTLFVKSSYLAALGKLETEEFAEPFKERMEILAQLTPAENEKKHINEEIRELGKLLTRIEGVKKHTFRGFQKPHEMVLTVSHGSRNVTAGEAAELSAAVRRTVKPHPLGILVYTKEVMPFAKLRTYRELLFPIHGKGELHRKPEEAAVDIWQSDLWDFLTECHKEETPFYFRLELKNKMDLAEKSSYARKFASELERISNRRL